jgi:hypothetical protein
MEQCQACLEAFYYRHPAAALAISCTAPAAGDGPLSEHVLVKYRGIEPAVPSETQLGGVGQGDGNGVFWVDHGR